SPASSPRTAELASCFSCRDPRQAASQRGHHRIAPAENERLDGVQHLSPVHQRVFWLQQVSEAVGLLEARISVVLAVRGMTGNLDRDGVLDHVLPVVGAERDPGDPGAEECAPGLELAPARQFLLGKQALVLLGLLSADVDDDDVEFAHEAIMDGSGALCSLCRSIWLRDTLAALTA